MHVYLPDMASTARLGRALAGALSASGQSHLVLLEGDLGAGKTTLARFLAEALPGGDKAEVSSPSFTLCNIYPTSPEVWHYDLYRLEDGPPSEEILDALEYFSENGGNAENPVLMLLEWPERLDSAFLPASRIHCRLTAAQNDRRASFTGYGKSAEEALEKLGALLL